MRVNLPPPFKARYLEGLEKGAVMEVENVAAILGVVLVVLQILRELLGIYREAENEDPEDR